MKHYLTPQNTVHGIEDGKDVPNDWTEITIDQAREIGNPSQPTKTTLELDIEKYKRRAESKNQLMAEMAAMNVGRLKDGTWTTAQLVALMSDPEIKSLISHIETLSFELAIGVINSLSNPIITPDIKATWIAKLMVKL